MRLLTGMPASLSVSELASALRQGALTSVELTEECLSRAEASRFGAWRKLTPERALEMARVADLLFGEDEDHGPLQGIPIGIKDNINMKGEISLAGLDPRLPLATETDDAAAVRMLEQAGAVIMGRCNMTELAFTALGTSSLTTPLNARDRERIPGGSSSGSAVAVAAGEVPLAIGSDTGGSIRIPAACNGIAGFKPGSKRLDLRGVFPLSSTLDTIGPLANSAADAELLYSVLDPRYKSIGRPGSRRAFVPETVLLEELDDEVAGDFAAALLQLEGLGIEVVRGELPLLQEIREARRYGTFAGWEAYRMYSDLLRSGADLIEASAAILSYGERDPDDYLKLQHLRTSLRGRFREELADYDLVLSPTMPTRPPLLLEVREADQAQALDARGLRNTQLFNFLGLPVLALPMGDLTSLSIAAHEGQENVVLAVGKLFEAARE